MNAILFAAAKAKPSLAHTIFGYVLLAALVFCFVRWVKNRKAKGYSSAAAIAGAQAESASSAGGGAAGARADLGGIAIHLGAGADRELDMDALGRAIGIHLAAELLRSGVGLHPLPRAAGDVGVLSGPGSRSGLDAVGAGRGSLPAAHDFGRDSDRGPAPVSD